MSSAGSSQRRESQPWRFQFRLAAAAPLAADLKTVLTMFAPMKSVPQVADPLLPWTETTVVDLGRRGVLPVRHTPNPGSWSAIPVVLLHGITMNADVNFFALSGLFGADRPVIVFDLPNHGTGISVDRFRFEDVADDVIAVLDELGVTETIVCGYSLGGIAAMVVADRHPSRIAGVIIQASAMRYGVDTRERLFLQAVSLVHRFGLDGVTRDVPARYWRASARHSPNAAARSQWVRRQLSSPGEVRLATVWKAVQRQDHRHLDIDAPTVVVVLGSDRVCPPHLQREVADALGAHVFDLDADHDLPVADPAAFASITDRALRWMDRRLGERG